MFPLSAEKLPFLEIADFWSREIIPRATQKELLALLESAWWRGELKGNSALNRLQFLKKMFESRREPYMQSIVFASPDDTGQSTGIQRQPHGGFVVRPQISVPDEIDDWTENSCADAFEALAGLPSQQHFPLLSFNISFIELTREEFFGWIRTRGFDVPTFWNSLSGREVAPKREGSGKEERKPTAKPPLKRDLKAAYKRRIETYRGKESPSRTDDEQWVREHFSLSVTKARDLRRDLAPPEWHKPGRRKRIK
jgi:hypothetical protein